MDSKSAKVPRTPPRLQHSQLTALSGTPHSQTVSSLGSHKYRRESVDPALQLEWDTYTATGVGCDTMLKGLFPSSTPPSPNEELRRRLEEALALRPEPAQYAPIANICNDILAEYYISNPPTLEQPARWFVPLGWSILDSDFAKRKPDLVVVIRSAWQEHVRSQLNDVPVARRIQNKEWKSVYPDPSSVHTRVMSLLGKPDALKAEHLDAELLRALAIHPPWECVTAIVEFKVSNAPESMTPTSPSISSSSTNVSGSIRKIGPKSKESSSEVTPGKIRRATRSPSIAERGTTLLASKGTSSSRNHSAKKSSSTPPASRKTLSPEVQLLSYFCEVMSAGRYRDWTSGAIICGLDFRLVSCDREGSIKSAPTSLQTVDGADTFVRWVLAVGSGTLADAGFSNIFRQTGGQIEGVEFSVPVDAKRASEGSIQLQLGKQHYQQYGAFGRGTTLYCVDIKMGNENIPGVCKISWSAATRDSEYDLIEQARKVDPIHLPDVICAWDEEDCSLPSRRLRSLCPQAAVEYEPRVLRVVVLPFYRPIHELEGDEFLAAFWDVMMCNVKLYEANSVHHRDSSINNMMYRREGNGQVVGILSDFDLAVSMKRSTNPSGVHRSGTAPFMALDLLKSEPCEQDLEHDFESALYILLWVSLGYKGWKPPPTGDPLSSWRRGTWAQIRSAKRLFINADLEEDEPDFLGLINPDYDVLRKKISLLHMRIQAQTMNKLLAKAAKRNGVMKHSADGSMTITAQEFFEIIGPPPPGRDSYTQLET